MAGEKILVVDDAPQNVKLLRLILSDAGYHVTEAMSGEEALQRMERDRPDAVILDVRMPGMSGYEVAATLRSRAEYRRLPIIMVTALSMPEERIKGIESGATDFITKPFNKRELLARLVSSLSAEGQRMDGGIALDEPLIFVDPQWRVLEANSIAAGYLGVSSSEARGMDFGQVLRQHAVSLPAESSGEGFTFRLRTAHGVGDLSARATDVRSPDGRVVLRVITLREEPSRALA